MPEQNTPRRYGHVFTLREAFEQRRLVAVRCQYCKLRRLYEPADLKVLVGAIGVVELERKMRCEKCGRKDYIKVEFWAPTIAERKGLVIRRLAGTRMVRKVIWRDETLEG